MKVSVKVLKYSYFPFKLLCDHCRKKTHVYMVNIEITIEDWRFRSTIGLCPFCLNRLMDLSKRCKMNEIIKLAETKKVRIKIE